MILDRIDNSHLYYALHSKFKQAFDHCREIDVNAIPVGRYEINGEKIYAMVQQYNTKPEDQGIWEAHRRYIDLQYVVQGCERIGYANIGHLTQGEYVESRDFLPLFGEGDPFTLYSGNFVLLMPEDAHMPGLAVGTPAPVKKIVIKISVE